MSQEPAKKFPLNDKDYELYEEVGEGVSATVFRAHCIPLNEVVAIKVLDLEKCSNDLDGIRREVQTMILIDHPNLLRAHCSFTSGHNLWVVMPYMAGGSCLHIMKSTFPEGFEEAVIATLLRETLKALVYLHHHGHIHRDVKAGNILLDSNGAVKLGDYGVSACMYDTGDRQRTRNTFVGTPCWMAPEVMQQLHGYDFKADIWSFGITALELAHGHAPFSKYPPMKVLLMTLQNAPPGLDYERDKRFSKAFKEMVGACLVKDPKKRPTSEKLLKHPFFKHARSIEFLERSILAGMPPLGERFRILKAKEADMLVQNKALYEDKEHLSQVASQIISCNQLPGLSNLETEVQNPDHMLKKQKKMTYYEKKNESGRLYTSLNDQEYIRGISAWNFNLDDLKNQAALIPDDFISNSQDASLSEKHADVHERFFCEKDNDSKAESQVEDELNDLPNLEDSLAAFPMKPLQALKGCFDVCEDDIATGSPSSRDSVPSDSEQQNQQKSVTSMDQEAVINDGGDSSHPVIAGRRKFSSGSLLQEFVLSPKKLIGNGDREYLQPRYQVERNYSGPLQGRHRKDFSIPSSGDDAPEGAVVERKGRFKVTSAEVSPKGVTNLLSPMSCGSTSPTTPSQTAALVLPSLQLILQQNNAQREELLKLIKLFEQIPGNGTELTEAGTLSPINPTTKERELQSHIIQLQQSIGSLVEELQIVKAKNSQLERKLNVSTRQEDKMQ